MAEGLQIIVGAETSQATKAFENINKTSKETATTGEKGLIILNNQLERLKALSLSPKLTVVQLERLNGMIRKTETDILKFKRAQDALNASQTKAAGITNSSALALNNLSRIAQDAPFGFLGIP